MTWQPIERGLRKYEGKRRSSYQILLRVGSGIISETYTTETDARKRLDELRGRKAIGGLNYKNIRLGAYCDKWLDAQRANGIRQCTIREYAYHADVIKRYFGADTQLKRISVALIREFENHMANELGLSPNRQLNIFGSLKRILIDAREAEYNVVIPPSKRRRMKRNHSKKQIKHLESHELALLLDAASSYGDVYEDFFKFLAFTGCRVSEALPLAWGDIDFANQKIHINKRRYEGELDEPKTESSNRFIEMFVPVFEMLKERKKKVTELYLKFPVHRELDLVFPAKNGGYRAYTFMNRIFKRSLRKAGLSQDFSLHDLRHSCATFLFSFTQNLIYVSRQLGHSNPSITLQIYTHLLREDHGQVTEAINNNFATFFNKPSTKTANN